MAVNRGNKPTLMVLASTYPRWRNDPEPGFVHELSRRLSARFHVIAVVPDAPGADPSGELDGVEVVRYRYAPRGWQTLVNYGGIATNLKRSPWKWLLVPGFVLAQYLAVRHLIRTRHIDLVHAHWLIPQGMTARLFARGARAIPYLVTSHGGDLFGLRGRLLNVVKHRVAASSQAMTVVSTAMKEEAVRVGLRPPQLEVLPMGADLRVRFVPDPQMQRVSDELLFVGRLVPKKGLRHLLAALPDVLARRPLVTLTIAGFGPEEDSLKAQARRLDIDSHVKFAGAISQNNLPALYRRASLFVAPFIRDADGNQEGLPVALMEAIGCECPMVVGDVAGVRDLLGEKASTVCVRVEDTATLASTITKALEHPSEARMCARMIRKAVIDRVDWKAVACGYAALIDSCIVSKAVGNDE